MAEPTAWLAERKPPPPEELRRRLALRPVEGGSISETLGVLALGQLDEALARPGRDREGAFHLLATDALLTYACEAAAGEEDMERRLSSLLAQLRPDAVRFTSPRGS